MAMLTIRREQMDALGRDMLQRYKQQLAPLLLERHPGRFAGPGLPAAQSFVDKNLPLADKYGIESALDVALFLDFVLIYGSDFATKPEHAWATAILEDPESDGNLKAARLDSMRTAMEETRTRQAPGAGG